MRYAALFCVSILITNTIVAQYWNTEPATECLSQAQQRLQEDWQSSLGSLARPSLLDTCLKPCKRSSGNYWGPRAGQFFGELFTDVVELGKNLFSWDSFKILIATFPFYVASRMIDEKIQNCFYDRENHKNTNQMPGWCHELAEWSIGVPIVFFGLEAFFSRDPDMRETSKLFLIGMPFVIWTKDIIKQVRFKACLRPWNGNFDGKQRSMGGFPVWPSCRSNFCSSALWYALWSQLCHTVRVISGWRWCSIFKL